MLLRTSNLVSRIKLDYCTLFIDANLEYHLITAKDYNYIKLCLKKITPFHLKLIKNKNYKYEYSLILIKIETKYDSCVFM